MQNKEAEVESLSGEVSSYTGAVAGLAVVLAILLVIALGVIYYLWKKLKKTNQVNELADTNGSSTVALGTHVLGDTTHDNMKSANIMNETAESQPPDQIDPEQRDGHYLDYNSNQLNATGEL